MKKIDKFTKETLKELRPEIQAVLDMIHDEYGVKLEIGNISFSADKFTTRLTGWVGDQADKTKIDRTYEKAEAEFRFACKSYGLKEEHLGKTLGYDGKLYKIIGLNRKSQKYPILVKREDGKVFKFGVIMTRQCLGIKTPIFYRFGRWEEGEEKIDPYLDGIMKK